MPKFYLLDTNIIIAYINHENNKLTEFLEDHQNVFYYTETVQKEINEKHKNIPAIFKFVKANIPANKIVLILDQIVDDIKLTPIQRDKFLKDLTIILEAGFVCYDITLPNDYTEPHLLTHNLKLYNKFISNPKNKIKLEKIIDLNGLEHLIEVVRPSDVIIGYP